MEKLYVFTSVVYKAYENKIQTTNEVFKSKDKALEELEHFQKHFEDFTEKGYDKQYLSVNDYMRGYENKCDNGDIYRWEVRTFITLEIV